MCEHSEPRGLQSGTPFDGSLECVLYCKPCNYFTPYNYEVTVWGSCRKPSQLHTIHSETSLPKCLHILTTWKSSLKDHHIVDLRRAIGFAELGRAVALGPRRVGPRPRPWLDLRTTKDFLRLCLCSAARVIFGSSSNKSYTRQCAWYLDGNLQFGLVVALWVEADGWVKESEPAARVCVFAKNAEPVTTWCVCGWCTEDREPMPKWQSHSVRERERAGGGG